jgi:hypothetical protein
LSSAPLIGIIGPCKAGKSTLAANLQKNGYNARQIAQEHSFAPDMWRIISNPEILIFLEVNYQSTLTRGLSWLESEYDEQRLRLAKAKEDATFVVQTDQDSPEKVLSKVMEFIDWQFRSLPPKESK